MSLAPDLAERLRKARLYLVTGQELSQGRTTLGVAEQALQGGVDILQLREYSMSDAELLRIARELRQLTLRHRALFIINNRPDVASLVGSDGVHLGQEDLPVAEARRVLGPGKIVGVSTHGTDQALQAVADGADYIGVGPVYPTQTKKDVVPPVTLEYVRAIRSMDLAIPFFAIGGIKHHNAMEVLAAGASRLAVVTAIVGAADPRLAAAQFKDLLDKQPVK